MKTSGLYLLLAAASSVLAAPAVSVYEAKPHPPGMAKQTSLTLWESCGQLSNAYWAVDPLFWKPDPVFRSDAASFYLRPLPLLGGTANFVPWPSTGWILAHDKQLSLTVSSLSPAVLLENAGATIDFFCGLRFQIGWAKDNKFAVSRPRYAAFAADGKVKVLSAPGEFSLDDMSENWMLVWFGKRTGFKGTPYPYTLGYIWGTHPLPNPMLAWRDVPWLIVFQRKPARLELVEAEGYEEADEKWDWNTFTWHSTRNLQRIPLKENEEPAIGMTIAWPESAGAFLVMPLLGNLFVSPSETELWPQGLPPALLERCRQWSRRLAAYPVRSDTAETSSEDGYNIETTVKTGFRSLNDEWNTTPIKYAPLPPTIAGCVKYGLPLELSEKPVELDYASYLGPVMEIADADTYKYGWKGFGKYALERPRPNAPPPEAGPALEALRSEIAELLSADWAPFFLDFGKVDRPVPLVRFGNPADLPLSLLPALPYLTPTQSEQAQAYLRDRLRDRPFGGGPRAYPWGDARQRVLFPCPPEYMEKMQWPRKSASYLTTTPEELYAAGTYAGECGLAPHTLAAMLAVETHGRPRNTGEAGLNNRIMELIGRARICRKLADAEGAQREFAALAQALMRRFFMRHYVRHLYDSGIYSFAGLTEQVAQRFKGTHIEGDWAALVGLWGNATLLPSTWTKPGDDVRGVIGTEADQLGYDLGAMAGWGNHYMSFNVFDFITPELARFMRDTTIESCAALVQRIDECSPDWFLPYTPNQNCDNAEITTSMPQLARDLLLARAWILQEPPDKLFRLVREPWGRADLDYIDKLKAVLDRYAGWTWEKMP